MPPYLGVIPAQRFDVGAVDYPVEPLEHPRSVLFHRLAHLLKARDTALEPELQRAIDAARCAAGGLRAAVNDLRLEEERNRPFPELVGALVQRNRMMARNSEVRLEVEEGFPATSFGDAGTEILRVIQEALTNARRHSVARKVQVRLGRVGDQIVAEVADDG